MKHQAIHDAVTKLCGDLEVIRPVDTIHVSFGVDVAVGEINVALDSIAKTIRTGKYTKLSSIAVYEKDNLIHINVHVG